MDIELTPREAAWFGDLTDRFFPFKANWQSQPVDQRQEALEAMRAIAEVLHTSLKERGLEPQHSRVLIENRAKHPGEPFYLNLHALEDLIRILGGAES